VFELGAGCTLTYGRELEIYGLQGGGIEGMAMHVGLSSNSAILSSDEQHLYVSNPFSGQATVLGFDAGTGVVSPGCISAALTGFPQDFDVVGQIAAAGVANNADVLWLAEDGDGQASGIGILTVNFDGTQCTVTEAPASPAAAPDSVILKSLSAY
jgi:hypothetical protein